MASQTVLADNVTFTAQAPSAVVRGERFRISYKVTDASPKQFRAPDMKGLSVLAGPSTSTSQSTTVVNGKVTSSSSYTYTFIVVGDEEGDYKLDGATITVGKDTYTSNGLTIKVLPPDSSQPQQGQQSQQNQSSQRGGSSQQTQQNRQSSSGDNIGVDDLFMLSTVDKTTVYEQEALLLTFKVYCSTSLELSSLSNKMPDLKNFHVQEVELPRRKEFQLERYNGRNYQTLVWSQYVLFPQQSGELEIPATTFEGVISQPVRTNTNDIFDFFYNSGRYIDIKKDLVTRKITLNVKPLPSGKTSSFYGGVGDFSLSSSISSTEVTANDAVTVKVVLSGTGNLKLVKTPELDLPKDFDIYDPKVDNKYTIKGGRQTGNKVYEYLFIPRHAGDYTIPALEFQYFDPQSGSYKTLKTEEYRLNVAKSQGGEDSPSSMSYVSKEDLKYVGQDVRFHTTGGKLRHTGDMFFCSKLFWLLLILPISLLALTVVLSRKRISDNANTARIKVKKASSTASKRLKTARKLLSEGNKDKFYDETMRALLGYLSDKLVIPVANLSKDNIGEELRKKKVSDEIVGKVIGLLDDCEFTRYAPGDDTDRMDRLYEHAANAIGTLEDIIK
ncbi:MAG: protein BatD [Bacteroidaceae bacterium]|nr:protein BatD [Bacteroidaceae bacterium]